MDKDIAAEVGKIAALVARLGTEYRMLNDYGRFYVSRRKRIGRTYAYTAIGYCHLTKTRKSRRIPMLRALADKLRAELKEQKK